MGKLFKLINLAKDMLGANHYRQSVCDDPDMIDCDHGHPYEEYPGMTVYVDSALEAWETLFEEANDRSPEDSEREEMKIFLNYAYEEAMSVSDALTYLAASVLDCEEDEVSEEVQQIAGLAIMEYLNGNLKIIQSLYYIEEDEEED